jgi:autoinducer 2 (AI-2) kinase
MVFVSIDAGTTGVRCAVVGQKGEFMGVGRRSWEYSTPEELEIAKVFDPSHFWKLTCSVVREALKASKTPLSRMDGVATTSQRHGGVFLDSDGHELYAGPNTDARGAMTQYVIEDTLGEKYHEITGCWPPMIFMPTRLAWFEEEHPDVYNAVAHILPIADWIGYKLSGAISTDMSSASSMGFMDIKKGTWSHDVISTIGVDRGVLPEIHEAGSVIGEVSHEAEEACGLPAGMPLIQGGTDTHCALLACDVTAGEIAVIAGSTTPTMVVLNEPVCHPEQRVWTGCHILPGQWTVESNATLTGAYLQWVVNLLCQFSEEPEECARKTLGRLAEIVKDIPPGSYETTVALGPNIMNCRKMTDVPLARMFFPQPALPQVVSLDAPILLHAVLENIAYSVRGNCEQLMEHVTSESVKTIGGLTKSPCWSELLANVLGRPIRVPRQSEGSLLGAAMCVAKGVHSHRSLSEAARSMVQWQQTVQPDTRVEDYNSYYSRWKDIWCRGE